jgi:sulfite exporter TauE/SafE/copper chaperone CopZ
MNSQPFKKLNYRVQGMTCASCEVLIERAWKKLPGIHKVHVNHSNGRAEVWADATRPEPTLHDLTTALESDEYRVEPWDQEVHSNREGDYYEISAFFLFFLAAYLFLQKFDLLPQGFAISDSVSYGVVFTIGLIAAVSTCMAVTGGLVLAMGSRYAERHPELTPLQRLRPHFVFNAGRIVSYTVFGGAIGALGSLFTFSPRLNGWITVIASALMILVGLQLLHFLPSLKGLVPKMPKALAHRLHDISDHPHPFAPFFLGGGTFFLPCGFTQALQLYVLSTGDPKLGALTMLAFSLGTLPALLSLSFVSSFAKGGFQRHLVKFAGVLVLFLGFTTIDNGLSLAVDYQWGTNTQVVSAETSQEEVEIVDGVQIVEMKVVGLDYQPSQFTVVAGVPVEWRVDGRKSGGCGQVLVVPQLDIVEYLSASEITTLTFTPQKEGTISFTCGMGMAGPGYFNVVENVSG